MPPPRQDLFAKRESDPNGGGRDSQVLSRRNHREPQVRRATWLTTARAWVAGQGHRRSAPVGVSRENYFNYGASPIMWGNLSP
jgi:hypothetical protein